MVPFRELAAQLKDQEEGKVGAEEIKSQFGLTALKKEASVNWEKQADALEESLTGQKVKRVKGDRPKQGAGEIKP